MWAYVRRDTLFAGISCTRCINQSSVCTPAGLLLFRVALSFRRSLGIRIAMRRWTTAFNNIIAIGRHSEEGFENRCYTHSSCRSFSVLYQILLIVSPQNVAL